MNVDLTAVLLVHCSCVTVSGLLNEYGSCDGYMITQAHCKDFMFLFEVFDMEWESAKTLLQKVEP